MRRQVVWLAFLTALVTAVAGVAGFPGLDDRARAALVVLAAVVAGLTAVIQAAVGHRAEERRDPSERDGDQPVTPVPHLLPRPELFQLPPDLTDFINQEDAVRRIGAAVAQDRPPDAGPATCVVSGRGGVGKSAVAVHVAHSVKTAFPAGHLYANLRGAEERPLDVAEVLEELLRVLGTEPSRMPRGVEDRARAYRAKLAGGRFLLVLDNAADETQVRPLLPWTSTCAVLVTSRRRLSLTDATVVSLDVFDREPALALLSSIVGYPRLEAEIEAATAIVQLCGYLPLAVKIAGAKLESRPHWRITRLVERLQDDQARLRELQFGDVEVRSVMTVSYSARTERERETFRRLGLLHTPTFPAWAVSALVTAEQREAEDLLENLAEVHLVEPVGEDVAGQMHDRLHDLVRDFARERVLDEEDPATRDAALRRYISAYLTVATEAHTRFEPGASRGAEPLGATEWQLPATTLSDVLPDDPVEWFSSERANLTAIVQQAFDANLATLGGPLLERLSPFLEHQAYWDNWRRMATAALEAARRSGDRHTEAQALYEHGWVIRFEGRYRDSIEELHASSSLSEELGDRHGQAKALSALGVVLQDAGRWREAITALESSIAIFEEIGDRRWEARTRQELGVLYRLQGEWRQATDLLGATLAIFQELGDRSREARARRSLGDVYVEQGRLEEALATLESVRPVFHELEDRRWEATTTVRIGEVHSRAGRLDDALAAFNQALPVLRDIGDRRWEAMAILRLGEVHARQDRLEDALAAFNQALPVFEELGDRRFSAITTLRTGETQATMGRLDSAIAALDRALAVFEDLGDRIRQAETLRVRGRARRATGERALAQEDLRTALDLFEELDRAEDARALQADIASATDA